MKVRRELEAAGKKLPAGDPTALKAGPPAEREAELLAKFKEPAKEGKG